MRAVPVQIVIHRPKTEQAQQELAARVAAAHAEAVVGYIKRLECPADQKTSLAEKIMEKIR